LDKAAPGRATSVGRTTWSRSMSLAFFTWLRFQSRSVRRAIAALPTLIAVALFLAIPVTASAATTITAATGGTGMIVGNYTTLSGPTVVEGVTGDISLGTIVLTLTASSGFEFNVASPVMINLSQAGTCAGNNGMRINGTTAATYTVTPTATSISFTITRKSSGGCRATISWSGVQVRALVGRDAHHDMRRRGSSGLKLSVRQGGDHTLCGSLRRPVRIRPGPGLDGETVINSHTRAVPPLL